MDNLKKTGKAVMQKLQVAGPRKNTQRLNGGEWLANCLEELLSAFIKLATQWETTVVISSLLIV